jgi:hypothetical protein
MKIGDTVFCRLGNLSLGGKIAMIAGLKDNIEFTIELPCGIMVKTGEIYI